MIEPKSSALRGKVAVITGGSSGIGAAAARLLADKGAKVIVGYHKGADRAERLLKELPGSGHRALSIVLEDSTTIRAAADTVRESYGRADILVNSAGFTRVVPHADLEALTDEIMDAILIANVRGTFSVIRSLAPLLRESGEGVIINVSSIAAFTGAGSSIAYCAAKAALDTVAISLARSLGPAIRVLSVSPGPVATDFVPGRDRAAQETLAHKTPLERVVEPDDIAAAILACVTHLKMATGTTIVVDGGAHL
ncbi:MAG: SDR family oxidoreductase [Candidatus Acidiferrales bacterium]